MYLFAYSAPQSKVCQIRKPALLMDKRESALHGTRAVVQQQHTPRCFRWQIESHSEKKVLERESNSWFYLFPRLGNERRGDTDEIRLIRSKLRLVLPAIRDSHGIIVDAAVYQKHAFPVGSLA